MKLTPHTRIGDRGSRIDDQVTHTHTHTQKKMYFKCNASHIQVFKTIKSQNLVTGLHDSRCTQIGSLSSDDDDAK